MVVSEATRLCRNWQRTTSTESFIKDFPEGKLIIQRRLPEQEQEVVVANSRRIRRRSCRRRAVHGRSSHRVGSSCALVEFLGEFQQELWFKLRVSAWHCVVFLE